MPEETKAEEDTPADAVNMAADFDDAFGSDDDIEPVKKAEEKT